MKRIAAIMIASLFILTAFAVLEIPQNATVNHIPVPFPYTQSSPARPYVATSNGLTYTVEPNGTYLWNGHYLRAPPVPYPKVPTIAPDGLPYGAVGPVGAQGHVGPYSFTKGAAQIKGVAPNGSVGVATVISKTTSWDNTTVYLGGNVTWTGQYQLFINNTKVIFNESYGSQAWQYGFNITNQGGAAGQFLLNILDNSMITQKNTTSRPFYISLSWAIINLGYPQYYFGVTVQNSTVYSNGTETTGLSDGWYSTQAGVQKENGPIGLEINYFNYSAYYSNTPLNEVPDNGIGWGNFTDTNQYAWVGTFVSHSYISNGFVTGRFQNDTFVDSMIYPMRIAGYLYDFLGQQMNYVYLNYNTIMGLSTWRWLSFVNGISGVNYQTFINHTLVENSNITNSSFYVMVNTPIFSIQNTTFSNISFIQNGIPTIGNYDPEYPSTVAFQHNANSEVMVGAYDPSSSSEGNFSMVHSSFINVSSDYGPMRIVGFEAQGIDQSAYMRYDIFVNLTDIVTSYNGGDVSVYNLAGTIANATGIIMKNIKDVFPNPRSNDHNVMASNPFIAISVFGDGQTGYDWQTSHYAPTSGNGGYASNNNSWYVNISQNAGGLMANGVGPIVQSNNTFINVNNTVAIGMGTGSGLTGFIAKNNTVYGLYNYSVGVGGYNTGSDDGSRLPDNYVYDVSTNSISYIASQDNISFYNINGNLIGINSNGTISSGIPTYPPTQYPLINVQVSPPLWDKHSTKIDIVNSTITQLTLAEVREGYVYPVYTPSLLQNEFNITIENSYVPATFTARTNSNITAMHNTTENLFSYASGSQWLMSSPFSNPSFLNLTGYLGIYPSQTYTLNASNIKGESSLPVYLAGSQIASIPASSAHYNLTASYSSGTLEYSTSANSASDQPISLMWNGQVPDTAYSVAMYDHGQLIDYTNVTSSANGVVTFTYNPATMPLDPVFELTTFHIVTSGSTAVPPEVFLYVLLAGGALLGAGAIIVAAVDRRRYR